MTAVLGTWNPTKWPWDDIGEAIAATARGEVVRSRWSVSNRKHGIAVGDRFFLLKQQVEPRGIVASGTVASVPFEAAHWNNRPGATTNYVTIELDVVLDPDDVLPIEQLAAELWEHSLEPAEQRNFGTSPGRGNAREHVGRSRSAGMSLGPSWRPLRDW